jgi:hypothetical protein
VYLVVFNMELFDAGIEQQRCLEYLSFWVNSVRMYTGSASANSKIYLVGTRKDRICDVYKLQNISAILYAVFGNSPVWRSIVKNADDSLSFYPIDNNRKENTDPTIIKLRKSIEATIVSSPYIKIARPLSWFKALDILRATEQSELEFSRAQSIARENQVPLDDVENMLQFFSDMGMLMWHPEEPNLRNAVILDPIRFFVVPVTRVICDIALHNTALYSECWYRFPKRACEDAQKGVFSDEILTYLLGYDGEDVNTLKVLMKRYGLLVAWEPVLATGSSSSAALESKYLVPSLFPKGSESDVLDSGRFLPVTVVVDGIVTFYFVFSLDEILFSGTISDEQLKKECFLPHGLFTRLLCKTLIRCQHVPATTVDEFVLLENSACLKFGNVWFGLRHLSRHNCIQVQVAAGTAVSVTRTLYDMIKHLFVNPYVEDTASVSFQLIPLPPTIWNTWKPGLSRPPAINDKFSVMTRFPWAVAASRSSYDVFISYRQTKHNLQFTSQLVDRLEDYVVVGRVVNVFLDRERIPIGDDFRATFVTALRNSTVVVPVMCPDCLKSMMQHDGTVVDNALLEWLLALVFRKSKLTTGAATIKKIFPLTLTRPNEDTIFTFLKSGSFPDIKPAETQKAAVDLLQQTNFPTTIEMVKFIENCTVKTIISHIMHSQTEMDDLSDSKDAVLGRSAMRIVDVLQRSQEAEPAVISTDIGYSIVNSILQGSLAPYAQEFRENRITDEVLECCDSTNEETFMKSLGARLMLFNVPAKTKLFLNKYRSAVASKGK